MTEKPEDKIVRLMRDSATVRLAATPTVSINVHGSGNITAGGDVHVYQSTPAPKPRKKVSPGAEHISADQRKALRKLVDEVAETEARLKRNPKGHAAVYSALFQQFQGVTKLEQIPLDGFGSGRAFLHQWLGRLNAMKSAPIKNADEWRKKRYSYIKVNAKSPEDAAALSDYIKRNFGADSLTELANDELERTYRYVAGRRNRYR